MTYIHKNFHIHNIKEVGFYGEGKNSEDTMLEKFLQCSQRMGWLADFLLIVESCLTVYGAGVLESCTLELESA